MKKDTYNVEGIEIEVEHIDRNDGNREHRLVAYQFKAIREQSGMNRKEFSFPIGPCRNGNLDAGRCRITCFA